MKISRPVLDEITRHALDTRPFECCGVLLADPADPDLVINALQAANEAGDNRERNYVLGRKTHLRAVELEAKGEARVVGYYHSHVWGAAWPSTKDVEEAVPGVSYLIVGVSRRGVEFRAFRIEGDEVVLEAVQAIEDNRRSQPRRAANVH